MKENKDELMAATGMTGEAGVNWDRVRDLADLLKDAGLTELEWRRGGESIRLSRRQAAPAVLSVQPAMPAPANPAAEVAGKAADTEAGLVPVTAPMTGVFYASPSPSEPPFVRVGDIVEVGDTVCLLEAMKIFNELIAEVRGKVVRVAVANGELVKNGETLFLLEPA